jgi:hypothetical protein
VQWAARVLPARNRSAGSQDTCLLDAQSLRLRLACSMRSGLRSAFPPDRPVTPSERQARPQDVPAQGILP